MEKCEVRPLYRCCCCRFSGSRESEPLFLAVYKNNLDEFKALVENGKSVNAKSVRGNPLLNYTIEHKRIDFFDYLLSLDDTEIDCVDNSGRSPLLYAIATSSEAYFALKLIDRGASVHLKDHQNLTGLHLAAKHATNDNLLVGKVVIEGGGDLNARNNDGETPIFMACKEGSGEFAHMLIYYGADVTIPSSTGILPMVILSSCLSKEENINLEKVLFNLTLDDERFYIQLPTLVQAMTLDSCLYNRIVDFTPNVTYNISDLSYLFEHLVYLKARHFRIFIKKYGNILKEMIDNFPLLLMLTGLSLDTKLAEFKEILYIFLESDYVFDFVQSSDPSVSTIADFLQLFCDSNLFTEVEVTKIICILLSFGLHVTSVDLDRVYSCYGYCYLFKILLHMDINIKTVGENELLMSVLYYNPTINFEDILDKLLLTVNILNYYNHPKLKERLKESQSEEMVDKIKLLPSVPYLAELSRNVVRKYIVNKYNIENSVQFYTVLKWLPIKEIYKRIIALERKLYWF